MNWTLKCGYIALPMNSDFAAAMNDFGWYRFQMRTGHVYPIKINQEGRQNATFRLILLFLSPRTMINETHSDDICDRDGKWRRKCRRIVVSSIEIIVS